jgi:protein-L-isoaspartate(D-aspartate) O-methyltransferase
VAKYAMGSDSIGRMQFLLALRSRGIAEPAVLRAMDEVPRELFVDGPFHAAAYADQALPIACGQTISQPYLVAYMTEQLAVRPEHRVLEIGTGSGYQAAVLACLAHEVVSLERYRTLAHTARERLKTLDIRNVEVRVGDGLDGVPDRAPYDRVMLTGAAESVPEALLDQLGSGGVMLLPLGPEGEIQRLAKLTKSEDGVQREDLIEVRFVPLRRGQAREL